MNLDILISKYLDSELTPQEDEQLREILSTDKYSKDVFDASVELHCDLKNDSAQISPPEELVRRTEDLVLMKILQNSPSEKPKPVLIRRRRLVPAFASLVAIVILASVFQISDSFRTGGNSESMLSGVLSDNSSETVSNVENKTEALSVKKENQKQKVLLNMAFSGDSSKEIITPAKKYRNQEIYIALQEAPAGNDVLVIQSENFDIVSAEGENMAQAVAIDVTSGNITVTSLNQSLPINNTQSLHPQIYMNGIQQNPMSGLPWDVVQLNEMQATTFLGTTVYSSGMKEKKSSVNHLSQSFGYSVSDIIKIGLEVGFTEFIYDDLVKTRIPVSSPMDGGSRVEVLDPTKEGIIIGLTIAEKRKDFWWFAPFIDYNLFNGNDYSITGRAGLGLSTDGALGYSRIYGKYEVINGIYITLGAEGRLFQAGSNSDNRTLNSNVSLIYGLQFRFY